MGERLLIYDSFGGGHHPEFVRVLVQNWPDNGGGSEATYLVLHPKIVAELAGTSFPPTIEVIVLPQVLVDRLERAANHIQHLAIERDFILEISDRLRPTHWLWMTLDTYRMFLASRPMRAHNTKHRGILFMNHLYRPWRWSNLREQLALRYKLFRMLRNPAVERVLVLNDESGAKRLNRQFLEKRFQALPEPIAGSGRLIETSTEQQNKLRRQLGWPEGRRIALLLGALAPRKNALGCLQALELLPDNLVRQTTLLIHASIVQPESHRQQVEAAVARTNERLNLRFGISQENTEPFAILATGRVVGEELEARFAACNLVLTPYINFYSASGVMNHAIQHGKPCVVPHRGLMASLSKAYGLNQVCVAARPGDLARAWAEADGSKPDLIAAQAYLDARSPVRYAETLLG